MPDETIPLGTLVGTGVSTVGPVTTLVFPARHDEQLGKLDQAAQLALGNEATILKRRYGFVPVTPWQGAS